MIIPVREDTDNSGLTARTNFGRYSEGGGTNFRCLGRSYLVIRCNRGLRGEATWPDALMARPFA